LCRLHDNAGVPNLGAFADLNGYIQAHNYGGTGGAKPPWKIFRTPGKMCWTSLKKFGPLSKKSSPPVLSQAGYGQGRIKGGQQGQLPRDPRCKGAPLDEIYLFQIKYSYEKL